MVYKFNWWVFIWKNYGFLSGLGNVRPVLGLQHSFGKLIHQLTA